MIKVFLVEDESIVREGIKASIPWNQEGFDFCGEAMDGELAYPMILKQKPHILITDIKMPFMDGIELSRLIKQQLPDTKIIILSGYETFSYAREAIKIGVTDYLLKPISAVDLLTRIKGLRDTIEKEAQTLAYQEKYIQQMADHKTFMKTQFFNQLMSCRLSYANCIAKAQALDIQLEGSYYQVVLFNCVVSYKQISSVQDQSFSSQVEALVLNFPKVHLFERAIDGFASILVADTLESITETKHKLVSDLKQLMATYTSARYYGGIGGIVTRLSELNNSYFTASRAYATRFINQNNQFLEEADMETSFSKNDTWLMTELDQVDIKQANDFLKQGEIDEIEFFVEALVRQIHGRDLGSYLGRQYGYMTVCMHAIEFMKTLDSDIVFSEEKVPDSECLHLMVQDQTQAKQTLCALFQYIIGHRDQICLNRYYKIIASAKAYIDAHFTDEHLTLSDVATYVHMSSSHFSHIFSKKMGISFIRYVTDLRMSEAKNLLKCTDLLCSDISEAVGYKDAHYFSYLFKKENQCSPMQYRNSTKVIGG